MSSGRKAKSTTSPAWPANDCENRADATAPLPPVPADREELALYVRHHLNQTERLVIMLHYAEDLALDEVASVLRMAQAEVEEIHQQVVGRLKKSLISCEELAGV